MRAMLVVFLHQITHQTIHIALIKAIYTIHFSWCFYFLNISINI